MLPLEDIPDTALGYLSRIRTRSQIIYVSVLSALLLAIIALPFIYVTVSVNSSGIIQSSLEKVGIFSPVNGRVISTALADNKRVKKGTILVNIDGTDPDQRIELNHNRLNQTKQLMQDAELLGSIPLSTTDQPVQLQTTQYASAWQQFTAEAAQSKRLIKQRIETRERYRVLFDKKMISQSEYEKYQYDVEQAESALRLIEHKYRTQWNAEATAYRNEWNEWQSLSVQLGVQQKLHVIEAPVDGTLQNLAGVQVGSFVSTTQKLAEISPDSLLVAYCLVSPADIGFIHKGQAVHFRIDAFDYNLWGTLPGNVLDISDDVRMVDGLGPMFQVKCTLNRDHLLLKNGYKGELKKGMTFTAHFSVARRSLFQLLYEKADDWLNPTEVRSFPST